MKVKLPASIDEAVGELGGLGELLRAKEWHKAAIVASFVRLTEGGRPARNRAHTGAVLSAKEFAKLGIVGLRKEHTVAEYVHRWLEANNGKYPLPGEQVTLPTDDWPPTRTGTDGFDSEDGAQRTIDRLIEKHGAGIIAETVTRRPDVAAGFAGNEQAVGAVIEADYSHAEGRAHERRRTGQSPAGNSLDAGQKLMLSLGILALEGVANDVLASVTRWAPEGDPDDKATALHRIDASISKLVDARALLAGVSDDDLANLLAGREGDT